MQLHKAERQIFVCSALNGITDILIETGKNASVPDKMQKGIGEYTDRHMKIINEIFKDSAEYKKLAIDFMNEKIKELKKVLQEIQEFGPELYFMDYTISFGEKLSTYLLYLFVKMKSYPVEYIIGEDIIITDSNFGNSLPIWDMTRNRIRKTFVPKINDQNNKTIFCVTGFTGRNKLGYTTTLGRGGSDFTATIIARSLYDECNDKNIRVVLWKDVDGILSTNPKYVKEPRLLKVLNYDEAKEMAFYGAKILHPKCLFGLDERHIPVEIRNFDKPDAKDIYSVINDQSEPTDITGISTIEDVALLAITSGSLVSTPGVLAKIFALMGAADINVSLVAQSSSEVNTTFIVEKADGDRALKLITTDNYFKGWAQVELRYVSILAITGKGISKSMVQAKIFESLAMENINIIAMAQSSDGLNLSMVLNKDHVARAVGLINECQKCTKM